MNWARQFPAWGCWLPPGLVVKAINAPDVPAAVRLAFLLIFEVGAAVWIGLALLSFQLRNGVVAASSRETGRSAPRVVLSEAPRAAAFFARHGGATARA